MSNQVSFEKFDVQCSDLVEKSYEFQKKLVQMETECHEVVVEEDPQVRSVDFFFWNLNQRGLKKSLVCKWMDVLF